MLFIAWISECDKTVLQRKEEKKNHLEGETTAPFIHFPAAQFCPTFKVLRPKPSDNPTQPVRVSSTSLHATIVGYLLVYPLGNGRCGWKSGSAYWREAQRANDLAAFRKSSVGVRGDEGLHGGADRVRSCGPGHRGWSTEPCAFLEATPTLQKPGSAEGSKVNGVHPAVIGS